MIRENLPSGPMNDGSVRMLSAIVWSDTARPSSFDLQVDGGRPTRRDSTPCSRPNMRA